jgi:hypothetical protein
MYCQVKYNLIFSLLLINVSVYSAESVLWDMPEAEIKQKREADLKNDYFSIIFKRLAEKRNAHLVIFNDISEIFRDFFKQNPVARYFILALSDRETVLCSKAILKNIHLKFMIWKSLLSSDARDLRVQYPVFFETVSDDDLVKLLLAAKKIDKLMPELRSNEINPQLEEEFRNISDEFKKLNECLFYIFFMYEAYNNIVGDNSYDYLEVNQDYILCIPKEKKAELYKDIPVSYISAFIEEQSVNFLNIYLGLDLNRFRKIGNIDIDLKISKYQVSADLDLGKSLQEAIKKIFVSKNSFSRSEKFPYLLPKFNIFLMGHGSKQEFFLGIEDRYLKPILFDLKNNVWMNNLLIFSCYPAARFQNLTNTMEADRVKIFSPLDYTVIFVGSSEVSVYGKNIFININYQNNFKLNIFKNIFKILDNEGVNYEELFKEISEKLEPDLQVANYLSILFPYADWVTTTDFSKNVLNLTKVKTLVLLDGELDVSPEKNLILLNANNIFGTLNFTVPVDFKNKKIPMKILPVNYRKKQYFISKMKFRTIQSLDSSNQNDDLAMNTSFSSQNSDGFGIFQDEESSENYCGKLLSELFSFRTMSIEAPVFILIDQLVLEDSSNCRKEFYKVLIDIKDKNIFFNSLIDNNIMRYFYDWSKDESLLAGYDTETFFDFLRTKIIDKSFLENQSFIEKLKNISEEINDIPEEIKRSKSLYQIEKRLEELKKEPFNFKKALNPDAKEFKPKVKAEPKALKKRRVNNPYAKF